MRDKDNSIFLDSTGKRWKKVLFVGIFCFGLIFSLLFMLTVSIYFLPSRPSFLVPTGSERHTLLPRLSQLFPTNPEVLETARIKSLLKNREEYQKKYKDRNLDHQETVAAFLEDEDAGGYSALKSNLSKIDLLFPRWVTLDANGNISYGNDDYIRQVLDYVASSQSQVSVMPVISNIGKSGRSPTAIKNLMSDEKVREKFWEQILSWTQKNKFAGITLDIQETSDQKTYNNFIEETANRMHAAGLKLAVVVPPDQKDYPYTLISSEVNYVALPLFDESYKTPGSVASISWIANLLEKRSKDIPEEKLLPIIGTHSYDWEEGFLPKEKTFEEAILTAGESSSTIVFDPESFTPKYAYYDELQKPHTVWMEDAVTAFNAYTIARQYGKNIAVENLGGADAAIWSILDTQLLTQSLPSFENLFFHYLVDYEGKGEILQIESTATSGTRTVVYDTSSGLVQGESYVSYPTPYIINHYGAKSEKMVSLTFDDGPDDLFTLDILDILKRKKAPATFFVVGEQAQLFPKLVKREYAEGHLIGNHTYTHPDISNISQTQLRLEISATERLIESLTGHETFLFRAPYAADGEPDSPEQVAKTLTASTMGYLFVGMNIDPQDWRATTTDSIVDSVLKQAENREGNVILLHDGGADRSLTVAALPNLIDTLRSRGYSIVPLEDLIGKSQEDLMPEVPLSQRLLLRLDALSFGFLRSTGSLLRILFIIAIALGIARFFSLAPLAIREFFIARKRRFDPTFNPSVAVVIAAYNEEKVVIKTVEHVLAASYGSRFEVIVVDDGSIDRSLEFLQGKFSNNPKVRIFTQENKGKARALNYGISQTDAEIIVTLDADTLFLPDTVEKLVRHFNNPAVAGVAGNAKVGNRVNLLTRWQALEYIVSQNLDKRAFSLLNCIIVIPGAVGAWRRSVIEKVGLFSTDTLAEDTDLTLAIEKLGHKVIYEETAIALTEAPDTVQALIKQRYRWTYGTYQACWKHKSAFLNPQNRSLGFVTFPNIVLFQIFLPLLSPILDLFVFVTVASLWITWTQHPEDLIFIPLLSVLFYYLLFLAFDYLIAVIAFSLEKGEDWWLISWLILQRFYYRQLMYYIVIKSIISTLRGGSVGWNKLERKGNVTIPSVKK